MSDLHLAGGEDAATLSHVLPGMTSSNLQAAADAAAAGARRHLGDREANHDLKDCLVALLHDSQPDEHDACPPRLADLRVVYSR